MDEQTASAVRYLERIVERAKEEELRIEKLAFHTELEETAPENCYMK